MYSVLPMVNSTVVLPVIVGHGAVRLQVQIWICDPIFGVLSHDTCIWDDFRRIDEVGAQGGAFTAPLVGRLKVPIGRAVCDLFDYD